MTADGYACFETALGLCAIAWSEHGITGVWLPEANPESLRMRVGMRYPGLVERAAPTDTRLAVDAIVALLAGERRDLTGIRLDTRDVAAFHRQVYDLTRTIPAGATMTYGQVAEAIGEPGAARAVGQALGRNPFPIVVPCHRVLAAGGRLGGFTAPGGAATKQRLLAIEGAAALPLLDLAEALD